MFRKRLLSYIIDVIFAIIFMFLSAIIFTLSENYINASSFSQIYYYIFLLIFFLSWLYMTIRDVFYGRSIGKRFMHLVIQKQNGESPCYLQLLLRNITMFIWPIEAVLFLLGKERWGDRLAGTVVVEGTQFVE